VDVEVETVRVEEKGAVPEVGEKTAVIPEDKPRIARVTVEEVPLR